jgi:AAA family ATP:ADP antiporter
MTQKDGDSAFQDFSSWRRILWPVHDDELKKLVPMMLLFFFVTFNYNVLRMMKDTLVVTAKSSGAEVIPFIKVWAMFPSAIFMTWAFSFLANRYSKEQVFYILTGLFLGYFALFLCLYPVLPALQPTTSADWLARVLPSGCMGFIAMYRYWLFTVFYVMSELWGSVIHMTLLWGFANQITRLNEAKRFYGLYGVSANFSAIVAGQVSILCCTLPFHAWLPYGKNAWDQSLFYLVMLVLGSGTISMVLFFWLNRNVLSDPRYYDPQEARHEADIKGKISLTENFRYLLGSRYLLAIAVIVMSYNLVINLTEVVWKHEVRLLYPDPQAYNLYMNEVGTVLGIIATVSGLLAATNAIRVLGWTATALLTPLVLLLTSVGFFSFFFFNTTWSKWFVAAAGVPPLTLVVFFGTLQNCLARTAKYTFFDATKEMAFVPLSQEYKLNGKAAIDGICSRLGKSGGSVIHQGLLLIFITLSASAPFVAAFLAGSLMIWILAIRDLGVRFNALTRSSRSHPKAKETRAASI